MEAGHVVEAPVDSGYLVGQRISQGRPMTTSTCEQTAMPLQQRFFKSGRFLYLSNFLAEQ
jgi:hypothetical protein